MYISRAKHSEICSSIHCDAEKIIRKLHEANNYILQLTAYEVRGGINEVFFYESGILYLLICLTV